MSEAKSQDSDVELSHYLDIIRRRRWIIAVPAAILVIVTAIVVFTEHRVYEAQTLLVIEKERTAGAQAGSLESSDEDYYQTQYRLLQSETLLRTVYHDLDLAHAPDFMDPRGFEKLQSAIRISPILRSRLVYVSAQSHDAALAARIANHLSETFVNENVANQMFISKEVLQALQMKEGKTDYGSLPAVVNNPLIQTLRGEYAKLDARRADMEQRYTDKYPDLIALKSDMAALNAQINVQTDRIVASLKTELSGQLMGNNVRVIDPAEVPKFPVAPKKRRDVFLALLAGTALGLALAFLIEALDQSVRTQEDIENKLDQPFLGVIPQTVVQEGRVLQPLMVKELSLTSEAVRNMRTMVDFAGVGGKSKALLVTSSVQGEGKTYVASNLAAALSQLGETVLVIDGDLRRPSIHRTFGVSSERGLSDFLVSGRHAEDAASLVQKTEIPGLFVLPCGPRPPNPSELLNTPRLGALVAWAREHYDRVVVDCTPMFPINDTLLWGRHVASGVFVVRYGATRAPLISHALEKLATGGIKSLGVVINGAKSGGLSYSSYGYYYQQYYHTYHQEAAAGKAA